MGQERGIYVSDTSAYPPMLVDRWVNFVEQVRWATDQTGSARVWQNGQLVFEKLDFKALFDGLHVPECNIYWSVGIYGSSVDGVELFTDNIEFWRP
jgi:hypothetical protein